MLVLGSEGVDALGTGLLKPLVILYLTGFLAFTPLEAAFSLGVGAAAGIVVTPLAGALLDRTDARHVVVGCFLLAAAGYIGLGFARSLGSLIAVTSLIQCAERAGKAAGPVIAFGLTEGAARVRLLAEQRTVRNLGYALGGLGAAGAAAVGTRSAYWAVLIVNAWSFSLAAAMISRLPPCRPPISGQDGRSYRAVMRDRPYVRLVCFTTLLWVSETVLVVGIPLWIARDVETVPPATVGVLFALNSVLVVALQVRISRGASTLRGTGRLYVNAGASLACACALVAMASTAPTELATALLVAGVVSLTLGQMTVSAAEWGAATGLAPGHLRGRYVAMFSTGHALQQTVGPVVVAGALVSAGTAGWAAFALMFLSLGVASSRTASQVPVRHAG